MFCFLYIVFFLGTDTQSMADYLFLSYFPGKKLVDGKGIGGRGRLTSERIDYFQCMYGRALRSNRGDPEAMARATLAILSHYSTPPDHTNCPSGEDSWCRWSTGSVAATSPPTNLLPPAIVEIIKPVFKALSAPELLYGVRRCLNQNTNEAFHALLWGFIPKSFSLSDDAIRLGLNLAVVQFNEGWEGTVPPIMAEGGVPCGTFTMTILSSLDSARVTVANYKRGETYKEARKKKRSRKRRRQDRQEHAEGVTYKSGAFHSVVPPRKMPTCRRCGRPMRGHSRRLCV